MREELGNLKHWPGAEACAGGWIGEFATTVGFSPWKRQELGHRRALSERRIKSCPSHCHCSHFQEALLLTWGQIGVPLLDSGLWGGAQASAFSTRS